MNAMLTWKEFWHERPAYQKAGAIIGVCLSLFHIYTSLFGCYDALIQRSIHLGLGFILVFLVYSFDKKRRAGSYLDIAMIFLVVASIAYLLVRYDYVTTRYALINPLTWYESVLGVAIIVLVLEATRRVVSAGLFYITLAFLLYPFVALYLLGALI